MISSTKGKFHDQSLVLFQRLWTTTPICCIPSITWQSWERELTARYIHWLKNFRYLSYAFKFIVFVNDLIDRPFSSLLHFMIYTYSLCFILLKFEAFVHYIHYLFIRDCKQTKLQHESGCSTHLPIYMCLMIYHIRLSCI